MLGFELSAHSGMGKSSLGLQHFFNLSRVHPSFPEFKRKLKKLSLPNPLGEFRQLVMAV
jgi:hypothetical protein